MSKAHRNAEVTPSNLTVGRYELLTPLGVGGAATVYLARATGIGGFAREVAVKVLHPHLRQDQAYVADFLREARLAAGIRHPNVLPVLDVGDTEQGVFLVMDWVDGCSLAQLLGHLRDVNELMPLPVALRIMLDALAGLHAAHEAVGEQGQSLGLVHRDVSPHNLLLSRAGLTLLSDFGIAKPTTQAGQTRTGVIKGKLGYMAPEQLRGGAVDRRADVWAAGVTFWEMLAGRRPYQSEDEATLILDVSAGHIASLHSVRPELPRALVAAVHGALTKEPDERYASADLFRKQLVAAAAACGGVAEVDEVSRFLLSHMGDAIESQRERALRPFGERAMAPQAIAPRKPLAWLLPMAAVSVATLAVAAFLYPRGQTSKRASVQTSQAPQASSAPDVPPAQVQAEVRPLAEPKPRVAVKARKVIRGPSAQNSRPPSPPSSTPPLADNPYTKP
ncbi:MAG: serine/threonine-protein kinase [Deltaproteobacteria bacterium]|nr:serine/threonine-protein kinase [Deltaproteobacteria bacterium]